MWLKRVIAGAGMLSLLVLSGGVASAATFSLGSGGTNLLLPSNYDPTGDASMFAGQTITWFDAADVGDGLFVNGVSNPLSITYTYLGKEAGYTNGAFEIAGLAGQTFNTASSALNSTATKSYTPLTDPWLVDFQFTTSGGSGVAKNGAIDNPLRIGYWLSFDGQFAAAFLDDGGAGPDADFDDMVLLLQFDPNQNIPGVPVPAPLLLLLSGLFGLGFLGRFRSKVLST